MESWQSGRQELLEVVAKIYDKIRVNVETEIHHENSVFISRDELRTLQDKTARIAELENEISALKQKTGEQDSTYHARLAQDQCVENEQLVKENARLTEELKNYKSDSLPTKPQKPEGQNKLMTAKLLAVPGQTDGEEHEQIAHRNLKFGESVLAPVSTNSSLSSSRAENNNSKPITLETYNSLATKYNLIYQNWTDIKATRTQLEKSLRAEKDKSRRYNLFCDGLEKKLVQKRDKIRQLEEMLRSVEGEAHNLRQSGTTEAAHATKLKVNVGDSEDAQNTFESAALIEIRQNQAVDKGTKPTFESSAINNASIAPHRIKFQASNIIGDSSCKNDQPGTDSMSAAQDEAGIYSPLLDQLKESESNELPLTLNGERPGNIDAEKAHFQLVDMQYTGSTERNDGSHCSNNVGSQGPTIKTESQMDVPSLHDTPVVIQERSIKKRKHRKNPAVTAKIKVETISSSPIGLAAFHGLEAHESIDLDDIGDKQITPRKQRSLRHKLSTPIPYGSRSVRNVRQATGDDIVLKVRRVVEQTPTDGDRLRADSAPLTSSSVKQLIPKTSSSRATKRRRITTDIAIEELAEDGENIGAAEWPSCRSEMSDADGRLIKLLEDPMQSGHAAIQPDVSVPTGYVEDDSRSLATSNATLALPRPLVTSRDGSLSFIVSSTGSTRNTPVTQRPPFEIVSEDYVHGSRSRSSDSSSALDASVDATIPNNLSTTSVEFPKEVRERLKRGTGTPRPFKDVDGLVSNLRMPSTTKTKSSRSREHSSNIKDLENRSVRSRPLDKLGLHDFKINPNYNQGYDYAFTDVVRNQTERRCLPGCTKPECCGSTFRALAEAAWDPNQLPTASQDEADTRLLKEFLGDNAYKIRNMTKAEKEETLLQAKTRELANKHGRHRHAYERRQSPPGFWRMDFPSTQEERDDREKGERLERDLVAQRYNEAMRPGGAYLFRDE